MYTNEIEEFLVKRNYIIKKASEINELIDVNISTQIKSVHFDKEKNNYTLFIDNEYDGRRIFEFHIYTIDEYAKECAVLGIPVENLLSKKTIKISEPIEIKEVIGNTDGEVEPITMINEFEVPVENQQNKVLVFPTRPVQFKNLRNARN